MLFALPLSLLCGTMLLFHFLNAAFIATAASIHSASLLPDITMDAISNELKSLLSSGAILSSAAPPRWSLYSAPKPAAVVNVATESDVAAVVCTLLHVVDVFRTTNLSRLNIVFPKTFPSSHRTADRAGQPST
jgi:hypothetical protein